MNIKHKEEPTIKRKEIPENYANDNDHDHFKEWSIRINDKQLKHYKCINTDIED